MGMNAFFLTGKSPTGELGDFLVVLFICFVLVLVCIIKCEVLTCLYLPIAPPQMPVHRLQQKKLCTASHLC